jgi:transposase
MISVKNSIEKIPEKGLICGHLRTERTCSKILSLRESLWTFIQRKGVDPTNNAAERALRSLVIHRKLSFGTQSHRGSHFIEYLFSIIGTYQLKSICSWDFIETKVRSSFP